MIRAVEELEFIEGMMWFCLWYLRLSLFADLKLTFDDVTFMSNIQFEEWLSFNFLNFEDK